MSVIVLIGVLLLAWLCYGIIPTVFYKYFQNHQCSNEAKILLTFDDGPDPIYTERLMEVLKEEDIEAIFFLLGQKVQQYPAVTNKIKQHHCVGLHGSMHQNMWFLTPKKTKQVIDKGMAQMKSFDISPQFYRPPYGNINLFTLKYAREHGLRPMWWTAIVGDWKNIESTELIKRLKKHLKPGAVVVLHDSAEGTGGQEGSAQKMIEALRQWIPFAKRQGYCFMKVNGSEQKTCKNQQMW